MKIIMLKIPILMTILLCLMNSPLHAQIAFPISYEGIPIRVECPKWTVYPMGGDECSSFSVSAAQVEVPADLSSCTHACFTVTVSGAYSSYTVTTTAANCPYPLPWANDYVATFCVGPDACISENLPTTTPIDIIVTPEGSSRVGQGQSSCSSSICSVMIGD